MDTKPYLCGAARLAHQPRASFPLRLRLLVSDWSLEPELTNTHTLKVVQVVSLDVYTKSEHERLSPAPYLRLSALGLLGLSAVASLV